jgi:2-(1,2-epoxy-1,2-dihydrophenyl)acetyl-CoA isomerase
LVRNLTMATIDFSIQDSVATITLNRPGKFNAFNREMSLALQDRLDECQTNNIIRCLCITGAGKAFSAGQDLDEVVDPNGPDTRAILSEHYNPIILKIRALEKPVVAAVNGVAAGAGANIALCCDIVVATKSASFIQAFSKIGLVPDSGGTFFLPRLIGWQKASALAMLGTKVSADEAQSLGMIYKVFDDETFRTECDQLTNTLAQLPTKGLALTKQALAASFSNTLEQQLKLEEELQIKAGQTSDYKEGVQAFLEKRAPRFEGK